MGLFMLRMIVFVFFVVAADAELFRHRIVAAFDKRMTSENA